MADIAQGFYVTELMGMGVNTVTGDYSRGASGFWIENGSLAYPVSEVTIAGNLTQMFLATDAGLGSRDPRQHRRAHRPDRRADGGRHMTRRRRAMRLARVRAAVLEAGPHRDAPLPPAARELGEGPGPAGDRGRPRGRPIPQAGALRSPSDDAPGCRRRPRTIRARLDQPQGLGGRPDRRHPLLRRRRRRVRRSASPCSTRASRCWASSTTPRPRRCSRRPGATAPRATARRCGPAGLPGSTRPTSWRAGSRAAAATSRR